MPRPKPIIVGCAGTALSEDEAALFAAERPAGLILFRRNCADPDQLRALVSAFRETVEDAEALVMIDQEGGRVARLGPPHWRSLPPAAAFGRMAEEDFVQAGAALQLTYALIAADLREVGINVNCAPVLDVPQPDAHDIIGDRAFAGDPALVARLARCAVEAFLTAGLLPVIKHIPGHGRAREDSHQALPRVTATREELEETDFVPFKAVADAPAAMTAHVVYEAIDPAGPATTSELVIEEIIRGDIGFDGLLISDDITMAALHGTMAERASRSLRAGCDLVLHCSGDVEEARAVLTGTAPMGEPVAERVAAALARIAQPEAVDVASAEARLAQLVGGLA